MFAPLGWGTWQAAVASITGLVGKENIVSTLGVLYGTGGSVSEAVGQAFSAASAMSFLLFNLLCAPCFAAIGAIRREMNSRKWTWFAIGYECVFAYVTAFVVFQFMSIVSGSGSIVGTVIAGLLVIGFFWLLFRPYKEATVLKEE